MTDLTDALQLFAKESRTKVISWKQSMDAGIVLARAVRDLQDENKRLRTCVEHCQYAVIDPDGPLYGVDSKLIDEIEAALNGAEEAR